MFGRAQCLVLLTALATPLATTLAQETKDQPAPATAPEAAPAAAAPSPVSFLKDVAPILVENCVGCHNPKKAESKYDLTTFDRLKKGGQVGGPDGTLVAGKPDESYFIELLARDADPRMPFKLDPLPEAAVELLKRWVAEGATYDGPRAEEDWVALAHRMAPVTIPENYPSALPITALGFATGGADLLASGYHELTAWKVADGTIAGRIRPVSERVYAIAVAPDGKSVATASGDPGQYGQVQLWKPTAEGQPPQPQTLAEAPDAFFAVAFSPDGKLLAAGGADRSLRVWNAESGEVVFSVEDHADWVLDVAFSPDGKRLATASRDKTAKVFDVEKKEALVTFPGHAAPVHCVRFHPDGKQVCSGGEDNQVRIWNPDDEAKQTAALGGFGGAVFRLAVTPDGKEIVAASADKTVRLFENNAQRLVLNGHNDWVLALAISPDGQTIATGGWDGEIRLWNRADGKPVRQFLAAPGLKPPGQ